MNKVSFDFDGTLALEIVQEYALELLDRGIDVWVVTSRYKAGNYPMNPQFKNEDLFEITDKLNISRNKIVFTEWVDKWYYFKNEPNFKWHLDDYDIELLGINSYTKVKGIHVEDSNWKNDCEKYLNL